MVRLATVLFVALLLFFSSMSVSAQNSSHANDPQIPEKNGDYPDPEHPGVRVRVFVHEPKEHNKVTTSINASCSDSNSSAVDGVTGWHLPSSVTYRLNVSSVPSSVGAGNFVTVAQNAYSTWQSAVSGKVTFTKGSDTFVSKSSLDFQNVVAFGRTSSSALAVTYTRYYTASGLVADVDTIFNRRFAWSWTNPLQSTCSLYSNAYDAQDILTHETGHWMGLDDEYDPAYADNTMFGYGSTNETKKDTLTTGDTTAVASIYH